MRYPIRTLAVALMLLVFNYSIAQKVFTNQSVKRADLAITEVQLIEATRNPSTGLHKIKVSVTIKNNGDAPAASTTLQVLVQNHLLNLVAPPNPQPQNPWLPFGDNQPVSEIAPGKSLAAEYLFTETKKVITTNRFNMGVIADAGNILKEINEADNRSTEINVTPVDRTEHVAVTPVINTPQTLVKKDTLIYTIGKADFKMSSPDMVPSNSMTNAFVKIYPQGVTLRQLGDAPQIYASLIAPLHLPAGAVIRKIVFNYLLLPGHTAVPHLVLRSQFLTATNNEGYGSNLHISPYWVTSAARDGANGYQIKASQTDPGFSVSINQKASYYFEILASSDRGRAIPQESQWPNDIKMLIWSINVHYTLN